MCTCTLNQWLLIHMYRNEKGDGVLEQNFPLLILKVQLWHFPKQILQLVWNGIWFCVGACVCVLRYCKLHACAHWISGKEKKMETERNVPEECTLNGMVEQSPLQSQTATTVASKRALELVWNQIRFWESSKTQVSRCCYSIRERQRKQEKERDPERFGLA